MCKENGYQPFERASRKTGIPREVIVAYMDKIIGQSIQGAAAAADQAVLDAWKAIPCKGDRPSAEEFMIYMEQFVNKA